jgi:dTDP-D-glucose 4,6-dehydratase
MSKTERMLGWKPKYDIESGLKKDIEWFRKNISEYG